MQRQDLNLAQGGNVTFVRFTIPRTDLTAAATTQNITLFTLPAGGKILGVTIKHSTAFSGGGLTAMTVSVGSTVAGNTGFASAQDVFQPVADTALQDSSQYKSVGFAAQAVFARFTSTGGNVSAATAGVVDVFVWFLNVSTPLP